MKSHERYVRQSVLPMIRAEGQQRLSESVMVIIGCGALGSVQAELAARAGIGRLVLVDRDIPELHNLQRQLLFDEQDVRERRPKAIAATRKLKHINSAIEIEARVADITARNIQEVIAQADIVLDGTDNFETRFLINDACVKTGVPWIYGGVLGTGGLVMTVLPGQGPCLRCLVSDTSEFRGDALTCETAGILNTAVTWTASLQMTEAFRLLIGTHPMEPRLHTFDIWTTHLRTRLVRHQEKCICCGLRNFEFLDGTCGMTTTVLCSRNAIQITPDEPMFPDFEELARQLAPLGNISVSGLLLEFTVDAYRLIVFPDGRIMVMGTTDTTLARQLVARYIGN